MKTTRTIALTLALVAAAIGTGCSSSQNTAGNWNNNAYPAKTQTSSASYQSFDGAYAPMTAQSENAGKFNTGTSNQCNGQQTAQLHNWNNRGTNQATTVQAQNFATNNSGQLNPNAVEYTASVLSTIRMSNVKINQDGSLAGFTPFNQFDQSIQLPTSNDRIGSMWFNAKGQFAGWAKAAPDANTWFAFNGWNSNNAPAFTLQSTGSVAAYGSLQQQNTGGEQVTIISSVPTN